MKKLFATILAFLLFLAQVPVIAEPSAINCKVAEINTYGHAVLDITDEDFYKAGFALGDIVTVTAGSYTGDMPCFNGYYVDREATLVYINPFVGSITLGVNYGSFVNLSGVGKGDAVTIAMKEKGGALDIQEVNYLVYSDERADFASDEVFANFRPVVEGKLYRSVSPVDNRIKRARTADNLIREAGVQTVMNMVNKDEEIVELMAADDYDSPYYRELYEAYDIDPNWEQRPGQTLEEYLNVRSPAVGTMKEGILYRGASPFSESFERVDEMEAYLEMQGIRTVISLSEGSEEELKKGEYPDYSMQLVHNGNVIVIPIGIDYRDPDVMTNIAKGLNRMAEKEPPYLIHCSYGRDRTGVICALLEALCGASAEEITDDYMLSYKNLHEVPI